MRKLLAILVLAASPALMSSLHAQAVINFGPTEFLTNDLDVINTGSTALAFDFNDYNQFINNGFSGDFTTTVNGVTFSDNLTQGVYSLSFNGPYYLTYGGYGPNNPLALSTNYLGIVAGGNYDTTQFTLNGLTAGATYTLQVWEYDDRGAYQRIETLVGDADPSGSPQSAILQCGYYTAGQPGSFVVATFVASGTSQTFDVTNATGGNYQINAINLQQGVFTPKSGVTWSGAVNNVWDINTTKNWANSSGSAVYQDGDPVIFDDTGKNPEVSLAAVVSPAGVTFSNNAVNYSFSGSDIAGAGGLVLNGSGTVTLFGTNTFSGNTAINNGTLEVASALALENSTVIPTSSGDLTFGGGIGAFTLGGVTSGAGVPVTLDDVNGNSIALEVGNNNISTTIKGGLSDDGNGGTLVKVGTGTLTLDSDGQGPVFTYSGDTYVLGGTLLYGDSQANDVNPMLGLGTIYLGNTNGSADVTLEDIYNSDTLVNNIVVQSGNTGVVTIYDEGAQTLDGNITLGSDNSTGKGITLVGNSGGGRHMYVPGTIQDPSGLVGVGGAVTISQAGGAGTEVGFGAANTYSGATLITNDATLIMYVDNAVPLGSAVTVYDGSVLELNGNSDAIGSLSGAGAVDLDGGNLSVGNDNTSTTFEGSIITGSEPAGTVTKNGTGIWTLTGTNDTSFVVSAGTLAFNGGALSGSLEVQSGATGQFNANVAAVTQPPNLSIDSGGMLYLTNGVNQPVINLYLDGSAVASPAGTYGSSASSATYKDDAHFSGAGVLSVSGLALTSDVWTNLVNGNASGSWGQAANWQGGVIANGSNVIADFSQLALTTNSTVVVDKPYTVGGFNFGDGNNANNWILTNSSLNLATAGSPAPINVINQQATIYTALGGNQGIAVNGAGVLVLAGANTYSGGTTLNAGQLDLNAPSALGTGRFVLNGGLLDNTSGSNIILTANSNSQTWNQNLTFVGSSSLDMGTGQVTCVGGETITVVSNTLSVGGIINGDNNGNNGLDKLGYGTLIMHGSSGIIGGSGGTWGIDLGTNIIGNGAVVAAGGYTEIGRISGSNAVMQVLSGGVLNQSGSEITVGREGNGEFDILGGFVTNDVSLYIGNLSPGTTLVDDGVLVNEQMWVGVHDNASLKIQNNGLVLNAEPVSLGYSTGAGDGLSNRIDVLSGGVLKAPQIEINNGGDPGNNLGYIYLNSGTLAATASLTNYLQGLTGVYVQSGGAGIDSGPFNITINQNLLEDPASSGGGLVKLGSGSLTLGGSEAYTGSTIVSNGTLYVNGTLAAASTVNVVAGATLGGNGTVGGSAFINAGGTVSPGPEAGSIGTLTINGNLTLNTGANAFFKLNPQNFGATNDYLIVRGAINATNAIITVTNLGSDLSVGDSFKLLSSPVSGFGTVNLPGGYTWTNKLAIDGTIQVLSVMPTIPNTPTNITVAVNGKTLTISWPASYLGWILQSQTNTLEAGLQSNSNDWHDISGSAGVISTNLPINPENQTVFYRLRYPN